MARIASSVCPVNEAPLIRLNRFATSAGSTVTRIQAGVVDPSVDTLKRILAAAGFDLEIIAVRSGTPRLPRLGDLAKAWSHHRGRLRLDRVRWRAVLDELARHPDLVPDAIYLPPPPAGERIIDALLAAVAEKPADDAGLPRPAWIEQAPSLDEPYRPPIARNVAGRAVPTQLASRELMIDSTSLWRDPETVGT